MIRAVERLAFAWGVQIACYSLSAVRAERTTVLGLERLPVGPCIWVGWHRMNLLSLAYIPRQMRGKRHCSAFVPPGLSGATMRGWLAGVDVTQVPLPADGTGNPQAALKQMVRALRDGQDVAIALDGPRGPAECARPGALWLARLSGCPLVPIGFTASPSFKFPRWDRQIIPLPGARLTAVFGKPLAIARGEPVDDARLALVAEQVRAADRQARQLLAQPISGLARAA